MLRFTLTLAAIAVLMIALAYLCLSLGWISAIPSFLYPTTILLLIFTAVIYRYLIQPKNRSWFTQLYLVLMVVKLIAYLGYNLAMVLQDRAGAVGNVLFFLALYTIFTAVEIIFLYRFITAKTIS